MKLRLAFVASCVLLTGCANYDFARARRPDGTLDMSKLIADLAASSDKTLSDGVWIPLIHMDITTFEASGQSRSGPFFRGGYVLSHLDAWGPLFLGGSSEQFLVDEKGEAVESGERDWVLWGAAYFDRDQRVDTKWGKRVDSSHRVLLLFGGDHTVYQQPPEKAEQPAKKAP
jgi:hypothetical protein